MRVPSGLSRPGPSSACGKNRKNRSLKEACRKCKAAKDCSLVFACGIPHLLMDFPLALRILVQNQENLSVPIESRLSGRSLRHLMLESPFKSPVAHYTNIAKVDLLFRDVVARHRGDYFFDKFGDGQFAYQRRRIRHEAYAIVFPKRQDEGMVHVQMRDYEFLVKRFDFRLRGTALCAFSSRRDCKKSGQAKTQYIESAKTIHATLLRRLAYLLHHLHPQKNVRTNRCS